MQLPDAVATFRQEAADLLARIDEIALELQRSPGNPELVDELFRDFHTIKGSGAMFGFENVAGFTHHVETALDKVRSGPVPVSEGLVDLILRARDQIQELLAGGADISGESECGDAIIAALGALSSPSESAAEPRPELKRWRIRFRPDPSLELCGTNPALLFRELRGLGACSVSAHTDLVPDLKSIDPEQCYLWWEIDLETDQGKHAISDVFIFVEQTSDLSIEPADAVASAPVPEKAKAPPRTERRAEPRLSSGGESVVRVPAEKLDRLVNLVGELVMNQSRLAQASHCFDSAELSVPVEAIERLVAELRDNVLGIRMMPIGSTFARFQRLVHDVSAELGKEIDLVTEGAETEVDKSVLDQLGDPMVHLIRNSIDHGIEPAAERVRMGKPPRGRVTLTAAHTGSSVVVKIADDGRGLNAAAIRAKAIEKRLISADAELPEKDIFNMIFLPGFSTASQVTSLSGRGVGMDVVKRGIEKLRGAVSVSSVAGQGATFSLTLPLTLAIIDGLLIEIAGSRFIVPMSAVTENVELERAERLRNNGRNSVAVRGELIQYIRLRELFGIADRELDIEKIVIVRHEDQRIGLVVDRVLGSHQTVIQSVGHFYRNIALFSGATIMGDGSVALIVDVPGIVQYAGSAGRSGEPPLSGFRRVPTINGKDG